MNMRIRLHIIVLAIALALLPQLAHAQCLYEYYGKAGDTLYIGEDSRYNDTTAGPPYVYWMGREAGIGGSRVPLMIVITSNIQMVL
jgi:hypothetical protein